MLQSYVVYDYKITTDFARSIKESLSIFIIMLYFKPPRGNIQLQKLHDCVLTRMSYFIASDTNTFKAENNPIAEYMMSRTPMDRTGHFILRLLSSDSQQLTNFIINSEVNLFTKRIDSFITKDLIQFLKTSIRHIEELLQSTDKYSTWLNSAVTILKVMKSCVFENHYVNFQHDESCSQYLLSVPFQYCLPLVKNREISLVEGNAKVPCGKWKKLLISLFLCHLHFGLKDIASQKHLLIEVTSDPRLMDLKKIIYEMYDNSIMIESITTNGSIIYANEVETISTYFPPCMLILYRNLKAEHRLSHQARFDFSLYLKDIGMPLKESILFWKNEYLKPKRDGCGGCTHSWQRDSVRFEYGIRHMYGLEGSRKNYKAPSCSKIYTSNLGPVSEGGCPFVHFQETTFINFLNVFLTSDKEVYNNIVKLKVSNKPIDACFLYSKALVKKECLENKWKFETLHKSPVQFFNRVKSIATSFVENESFGT